MQKKLYGGCMCICFVVLFCISAQWPVPSLSAPGHISTCARMYFLHTFHFCIHLSAIVPMSPSKGQNGRILKTQVHSARAAISWQPWLNALAGHSKGMHALLPCISFAFHPLGRLPKGRNSKAIQPAIYIYANNPSIRMLPLSKTLNVAEQS